MHFDSVIEVLEYEVLGRENTKNLGVWETVHHIEQELEHHRALRARLRSVLCYGTLFGEEDLRDSPRPIIPYPTGRSFGGRYPGTSCQATIVLSLRDEKYILRAEALIKLARMRFKTLSSAL